MASAAVSHPEKPTENPQLRRVGVRRAARLGGRARPAPGVARVSGDTRPATRGAGRVVVEVGCGVVVYPAREPGGRWRATWYEGGRRRQCQAASEGRLAVRVEKITGRLAADAPGMEAPGAELVAFYLSPDRHPAGRGWSRKHADTQRRLCARYLVPVIGGLVREDIKVSDMQAVVNAAPDLRVRHGDAGVAGLIGAAWPTPSTPPCLPAGVVR